MLGYIEYGHPNRQILETTGCSLCVVNNFLKDKDIYGTKIRGKPSECFFAGQERFISGP